MITRALLLLLISAAPLAAAAPPVRLSPALESKGGDGTKGYIPLDDEGPFLKKITEKPISLWPEIQMPKPSNMPDAAWEKMRQQMEEQRAALTPVAEYQLADQIGEYVGWCGIVRQMEHDAAKDQTRLLVEHKYFDGLTDLHIHIVSIFSAGDFQVAIPGKLTAARIPPLSLVRVYGKVLEGNAAGPAIRADYIRVWDWGRFAFMDYGQDKGNPAWRELRAAVPADQTYDPRPDQAYYEARIGKR